LGRRNGITQAYTPFEKWECYQNKMWSRVDKNIEDELIKKCILFMSNHILYGNAMREVVYKWENSMINFLTNKSINRRAYLGHCAVCYELKIPEYITRTAWKELNSEQMYLADLQAEKTIKDWELWYMKKLMNTSKNGRKGAILMEYQMKLQLNF